MKSKNIEIEITNQSISIKHYNEVLVNWSLDSWETHNDFNTMVKIAKAIELAASGEIMKLRILLGKFLFIGGTKVHDVKDGVVNYFITTLASNGVKYQVGWTDCLDEIHTTWNEMVLNEENYNMTLCRAIIVERELGLDIVAVEEVKNYVK